MKSAGVTAVRLADLLKTALDELRMQMLGAQVLFGFQLNGAFQEGFDELSPGGRGIDLAALAFMVMTVALLIAAPCQHRMVEHGNATKRILHATTRCAELALAPFALAIGCDIYVVGEQYLGREAAAGAGIAMALLAMLLWYGFGGLLRVAPSIRRQKPMIEPPESETGLHARIEQMLTEARVILPGAQALLGFQLVVTMTKPFAQLPETIRLLHFAALAAVALSVMLLITPAAVHRMTFRGHDVGRFHRIGSVLVTLGLVPLALGIAGDFYVATARMVASAWVAAIGASCALALLTGLWFALPLLLRLTYSPAQTARSDSTRA